MATLLKTLTLELNTQSVECQLSKAELVDEPTTEDVETFCGTDTFATPNYKLNLGGFQDWGDVTGVTEIIHDSYTADPVTPINFTLQVGSATRSGTAKPTADVPFGGDAGSALKFELTLNVEGKPTEGTAPLMPKTLADLARTAHQLPVELRAAEQRCVRKSALLVTRGIRDEVRVVTGGDMRLSGVGRRGARVGAKFDVTTGTDPTAKIKATGPLHLIDRDTDRHRIAPRKRRGAKALHLSNGTFAASVQHPGTRGKHPWSKGINKTKAGTRKVFTTEIHTGMVKAIRVSWLIRWDATELDSDDFTIADLGQVEKESNTPWSTANPFREVAVARAFLGVAMRRTGMSPEEVSTAVDGLTLRTMKNAFQWQDDDEEEETEEVDPSDRPPNPTTPDS